MTEVFIRNKCTQDSTDVSYYCLQHYKGLILLQQFLNKVYFPNFHL